MNTESKSGDGDSDQVLVFVKIKAVLIMAVWSSKVPPGGLSYHPALCWASAITQPPFVSIPLCRTSRNVFALGPVNFLVWRDHFLFEPAGQLTGEIRRAGSLFEQNREHKARGPAVGSDRCHWHRAAVCFGLVSRPALNTRLGAAQMDHLMAGPVVKL